MLVFNQYKSFIDIIIYVRGAIGFGNFAECNMEFSSSFINFYTKKLDEEKSVVKWLVI